MLESVKMIRQILVGSLMRSFSCAIAVLLLLTATVAESATITVTSAADNGPSSLRQAISDAVAGDTIDFAINFTSLPHQVVITGSELLIDKNLTINGPGADKLAIHRDNIPGGV